MDQMEIYSAVGRLADYGLKRGLISPEDRTYAVNRLICKLRLSDYVDAAAAQEAPRYPADILKTLCDFAAEEGIIQDSGENRDLFDTELMDCLMPRPSEVIESFYKLYREDPKAATDYYYRLSKSSNYIRVDRIEKDLMWTSNTRYGDMIITVNLSKPEKDPRDIAAALKTVDSGYPKCALCRENEGFAGGAGRAARANHRLIPIRLGTENWFMQYSPYVYYNEHCILLNEEHKPMTVSRQSMEKLLEFIKVIPHYFVGSNADLPIVGGSILSHDHFQGGSYDFPMAKAGFREKVEFKGFEDVEAGIVDWPMSTIRLIGADSDRIIELADKILTGWRGYSDASVEIHAFTADTPHNTITPIARSRNGRFELDLVLRNNRTSEKHPLGIFHPHSQYHHIKRENIGLIEVMGLAILPARLLSVIEDMKTALIFPEKAEKIMAKPDMEQHAEWYAQLKKEPATEENAEKIIKDSVGGIFMRILENAGVYKDTAEGNEAFKGFCASVL